MIDDWTTTTYEIDCNDQTAKARVECGPDGSNRLQVQITTEGGQFSLAFNATGTDDWADFLSSLSPEYVAQAARGLAAHEIDFMKSCDQMREALIVASTEVEGSAEALQKALTYIDNRKISYTNGAFVDDGQAYDFLVRGVAQGTGYVFGSERELFHIGRACRLKPDVQTFVDDVWPAFCEQIKPEPAPAPRF